MLKQWVHMHKRSAVLGLVTYLAVAFMLAPLVVLVGAGFSTTTYLTFPPVGFTGQWFAQLPHDDALMRGLLVSVFLGLAAMIVAVSLAVGIVLFQRNKTGRLYSALEAYFLSPALVPQLVLGIGLLFFLSQLNLVGSTVGLLGGHIVMTLPFAIRSVTSAIRGIDHNLERAAAICGASPAVVLWRVTLPSIKPGIASACMFAFLVSFNNITLTLFIADIGLTTLPVVLFQRSQEFVSPLIPAIATCLLIGTVVLTGTLHARFGVLNSARNTATR